MTITAANLDLSGRKRAYEAYIARIDASKLTSFECPTCSVTLMTSRVPGDTFASCPYCDNLFFMVTHADGGVSTRLVPKEQQA